MASLIDDRIRDTCPGWCSALDALREGDDATMTTVCDAFRDRVRSACTPRASRTRADRGPKPRRPRPAALRRLTDIRRHLCSLRQAITRLLTGPDEEAPHLLVFRASRAITAMNMLSALPSVGLPLVPQWEDLEGWAQWLEGCNVHMKEVKAQISRAHAADSNQDPAGTRPVLPRCQIWLGRSDQRPVRQRPEDWNFRARP